MNEAISGHFWPVVLPACDRVALGGNQGAVGIRMGARDNDRVIGTSLPGWSSRKIGLIWPTRWCLLHCTSLAVH